MPIVKFLSSSTGLCSVLLMLMMFLFLLLFLLMTVMCSLFFAALFVFVGSDGEKPRKGGKELLGQSSGCHPKQMLAVLAAKVYSTWNKSQKFFELRKEDLQPK